MEIRVLYSPALDAQYNPSRYIFMASMASTPFSKHDAKVLAKVKRRAHRLDYAFNICGIKLGWGSIVGFIPALGDLLDFFMAGTVIHQAGKVEGGLEKSVRRKMWLNALFDFFIGFVPFVGDIADGGSTTTEITMQGNKSDTN